MRIFVTGGTGFIGSYFLSSALDAGHEVLALRRTSNTTTPIALHHEPSWLECDLADLKESHLASCDVVVHLASAGVSPKTVGWDDLVAINVAGTSHVIGTAHRAGVKRVVVSGSCHEYGLTGMLYDFIHPNAPMAPTTLYAASKAASFHLATAYASTYGLELFYGRIFTTYGLGQYKGNFWPLLRRAALQNEDFPMTLGAQVRDFIPVATVASKLLDACQTLAISPGKPRVENIGSGVPLTLLEFAQQEWLRLGGRGKILPGAVAERPGDVQRLVANISPNYYAE